MSLKSYRRCAGISKDSNTRDGQQGAMLKSFMSSEMKPKHEHCAKCFEAVAGDVRLERWTGAWPPWCTAQREHCP